MSIAEKLAKIQTLIERTSSEGERQAASLAMERLLRLQEQQPVEYRVTLRSMWQKKLFVAVCRKYRQKTYRNYRQKYTTTMLRVAPSLMDTLIWPEYKKYSAMLEELVQEVLNTVLAKVETGEEEVVVGGEIGSIQEMAEIPAPS
jgi:hypothetical protein